MKSKFSIALLLFVALCTFAMGQATSSIIIKGSVKAKTNGETLIGVQVSEIDATNRVKSGIVTDEDGNYALKITSPNNKLTFNLLGYKKQTLAIGDARTINVTMEDASIEMKAVTVIGEKKFGNDGFNIPRREISIAAQTLDFGEIEGLQVGSIDEALQGRIAGLDIVSTSGDPGSGSSMRIRGTSSITGSSEPLLVMNGIIYSQETDPSFDYVNSNNDQWANMLSVNPDDILEITVLKDAASTAIYGTRGANGVIQITTKRGAIGPTRIQYTYRLSASKQPKGLNILNGDDYTMMMKQALFNANQDESASNVPELSYDPSFSEYEEFNNNTDWINAVSQTGIVHDHSLSVSGGGERAQFRLSAGFLDNTGTIIGTGWNRISARTSMDYTVSNRLRFSSEFSFTYTKRDNANGSILDYAYRKMPNVSIYEQDINGNDTEKYYTIKSTSGLDDAQRTLQNPVALANLEKKNETSYSIVPVLRLTYDLTDPEVNYLRYVASFQFNVNDSKNASFTPWEVSNVPWNNNKANAATNSASQSAGIDVNNQLAWQPKFLPKFHSLLVSIDQRMNTSNSGSQNVDSYGISSRTSHDATQEAYLNSIGSRRSSSRGVSLSGRFNYSYKSKYVLGGTLNRSGSNKFGEGKRYGYFPGLSAKWIISDEAFMDFTKGIIDELSIRPSWGLTGKEPSGSYLHFSRYTTYDKYIDIQAIRPQSLRLSNLQWETTSQFNYGVDLRLFGGKLNAEWNAYFKRTTNMLFNDLPIPQTSGFSSISNINAGTMDNNGYELNFNANNLIKFGKFSANFNMNFANSVNKIIEIDETILKTYNKDYNFQNTSYMTRLEEGHSYGSIYGFKSLGVYKYDKYSPSLPDDENHDGKIDPTIAPVAIDATGRVIVDELGNPLPMTFAYGTTSQYEFRGGDAAYEDINHDGTIDELDIIYLGNCNPLVNGGFGTTLRYKDLSCTMFFNFRIGNKVINKARMNAERMYGYDNQSIAVNWRWRKDGDDTPIPRALEEEGYNSLGSSRYVEDASFVRFRHIQLNYTVPSAILRPYKIDRLSVYLNINNVAAFSTYTGVDPEVGGSVQMGNLAEDNNKTPRPRELTFGLTVGL